VSRGARRSLRLPLAAALSVLLPVAELWLPPLLRGLPRETYLMGFAAVPGTVVDDVTINAMGFTGDVVAPAKPPATVRVLTLGGSALFNRRMAVRVRERLQRLGPLRVEVVGAALRTHTSRSSVLKYELLRRYHFDYVLLYGGINDLWANHVAPADFREDYSHLGPWYRRGPWLDRCVTCRLLYNAAARAPAPRTDRPLHFASVRTFARNLTQIVDMAAEDRATPVLMTFAWSVPPDYSYEAFAAGRIAYDNPTNYDRWPVELWGPRGWVVEGLQRHNAVVRELARSRRLPFIDQEALIGKDLRWFGDPCHLSEAGTDRFVENVAALFAREGWLSR
jgi:lysophospholipase L1-like esterase